MKTKEEQENVEKFYRKEYMKHQLERLQEEIKNNKEVLKEKEEKERELINSLVDLER